MKRNAPPWIWAWLGAVVGLLLAVTAVAPAHWLAYGIGHLTAQRLQLQSPQGTVWNGRAQLTLGSEDPPGSAHRAAGLAGVAAAAPLARLAGETECPLLPGQRMDLGPAATLAGSASAARGP